MMLVLVQSKKINKRKTAIKYSHHQIRSRPINNKFNIYVEKIRLYNYHNFYM